MDYPIPDRRRDMMLINKKKRTCQLMDFIIPIDHELKRKQSRKIDKYLDLARELKCCGI